MNDFPIKNLALGIVGGIAGGFAGGLICKFLADQGFYGVILPGALVGLGFALAARKGHFGFGAVSGVLGLLAGLLTQWKVYSDEPSFFKLVGELKDYSIVTWIMLGLGAVLAFTIGKGNTFNVPQQKYDKDSNS